jgi:nicotinamidase-related amidase
MNHFIDTRDAALLLIDHQSGLFQLVKDVDLRQLRANVVALAEAAKILSLPVITTASVPESPNGPLIDEVGALPGALFVPRQGEINAWDSPAFRKAVAATGKKTLIIAGILTSICVTFPALAALAEGYKVFAVIDASGDSSLLTSQVTMMRLAHAGVNVITTHAVIADLQKTFNRPEAAALLPIYGALNSNYTALIESHARHTRGA